MERSVVEASINREFGITDEAENAFSIVGVWSGTCEKDSLGFLIQGDSFEDGCDEEIAVA